MKATYPLTSKSQITIPKQVRDRLGLKAGQRAVWRFDKSGRAYIEKPPTIQEIRARIGKPGGGEPLTEHEKLVIAQISEK